MDLKINNSESMSNGVSSSAGKIKNSYDSSWDDDVHESFSGYLSEIDKKTKAIVRIMNDDIPRILNFLRSVDSNKLKEECNEITSSISGI